MAKRIALYPGTFDPPTLGHLDIIKRAVKLVDHLVVGVATNASKTPLFTLEERVEIMREEVAGLMGPGKATVEVRSFNGLLMEFAGEVGAQMTIRGLRAVSDFEYEFQMVGMNAAMKSDVETVFLMADPQHQAIASRLVKEIAVLGGDVSPFVSAHVVELLKQRAKDLAN
ncbi:pantetheine-phosphate adenylyltransferase [Rhizomicrobium electricum]|uniref:Phosphopantetheine adenylyltransferase n=1 Tax=Rhizomicrobium electricum TaxID=480070 RepID=A0ABN1EBZ2_9PROT|nr:pantetheine-phosphate adenylyltransferase [Rhizomicrobium electricum]NIJ48136.1 pantetheine-phosphate adenylyltransferase [Rhizomicrobium electricum]